MINIIISIIILAAVILAVSYIIKEKKKGKACIGCPYGGTCTKCSPCSNINNEELKQNH